MLLVDETTRIMWDLREQLVLEVRLPAGANSKQLAIISGNDFFVSQNTG